MIRKKFLILLLVMILPGVFWASNLVYAMPVGTLLYRTSRDGEMYGYNTKNLFQLIDFSLAKGLETVKVNCGHVGIYVGKINGEDMVLEAIDNGVQLTPAKYFVDTREGEKFVGARIPKIINANEENEINVLASIIGKIGLNYDWGFSDQKGPGSGQWICVGLAEKIYESLKSSLQEGDITKDTVLQNLEYNPAKYAINITPDGFDDNSIYDPATGDVLATDKEFSKIAMRDWEPSYVLGKITPQGRYFFLPYTQFIQPTLTDVKVDIPLASDFEADKIRGSEPLDKLIIVALTNTAVKKPLESAVSIYLAVTLPNSAPLRIIIKDGIAKITGWFFSGMDQLAVNPSADTGKVLVAVASDNTFSLDKLLGVKEALADSGDETDASDLPECRASAPDSALDYPAAPSQTVSEDNAVPAQNDQNGDPAASDIAAPDAQDQAPAPDDSDPLLIPDQDSLQKNYPIFFGSGDNAPATSASDSSVTAPDKEQTSACDTASSALDIFSSSSVPEMDISTTTVSEDIFSTSTIPDIGVAPVTNLATTTAIGTPIIIVPTSTPPAKPIPAIESFALTDPGSGAGYARNRTVAAKVQILNPDSVSGYSLAEATIDNGETAWLAAMPANFNLSAGDGRKIVQLSLQYDGTVATTASAEIVLDTAAPSVELNDLPLKSTGLSLAVSWQGSDNLSGIASYEVDYAISAGSDPASAVWKSWLSSTTATSGIFAQTIAPNNYLFFRGRALDRAGNQGGWSQIKTVKIIAQNIVISEFATNGPAGAADEFVELYNPGSAGVSLAGWKLQTKSATASSSWLNRAGSGGLAAGNIPAHGYFLLAANSYSLKTVPDYQHDANWGLADSGGSLRILDAQGNAVDQVSYGKAAAAGSEINSSDFTKNEAAERKALATSTSALMVPPGAHSLLGNGYDTDSDTDFVVNAQADPLNSSSPLEPRDVSQDRPAAITDLAVDASYSSTSSLKLTWSAPAFADSGAGAKYEMKYQIKNGDCNLFADWDSATAVEAGILPIPAISQAAESAIISGLQPAAEYCFALKDYNGYSYSELSNQAAGKTKAMPPPPDIQTMLDQEIGEKSFRCGEDLNWCGQSFVATKNNISGFEVASGGYFGGQPFPSLIELCDYASDNFGWYCSDPIVSQSMPDSTQYSFNAPVPLVIGQKYLIKIHSRGYGYGKFLLFTDADPYAGGRAYNTDSNYPMSDNDDLWLKIYFDNNYQP